jgi:dihydropteroate synthase
MHQCVVNKLVIGGDAPVRLMGVINCSPESFYAGSYIPVDFVHKTAVSMIEQGADLVDIGARSTAPNVQPISGSAEASRMDEALRELDGSGITVSIDTMTPGVLEVCLKHDIHAVNDISGLGSPLFARQLAASGLPTFLMASNDHPGDAVGLEATLAAVSRVTERCEISGIKNYILDPGIGIWTPFRSVKDDWTLCRHFSDFKRFDRPLLVAVSRKTFIGDLLNREPEGRLAGTLAVTMILLKKGASVVRTHDVAETRDIIQVYEHMEKSDE